MFNTKDQADAALAAGLVLCGVETEYGLSIEGRSVEDQVDDAIQFVGACPDPCFVGWDYHHESPRRDLRGFSVAQLAFDPEDAKFDQGKTLAPPHEVRNDRVLLNGARFYNDHGHPEYSTPECFSLREAVLHDKAGEIVLRRTALAFAEKHGREASVYKNNTDFHGSSYGTHENYLVPRSLGYESLFAAVTPVLIARQILCGAGKVGSETIEPCHFQISSRADFFAEQASLETLFRRPIFNTRDEPHADPNKWIRLHVIAGDANMSPTSTFLKLGIVKLAVLLAQKGAAPTWKIADPVKAFQSVSRDLSCKFEIPLGPKNWTTAYEILESLFATAEHELDLEKELKELILRARELMADLQGSQKLAAFHIDWCAKKKLVEMIMDEDGLRWSDPSLLAYDLEYHNIDPELGLYHGLALVGDAEPYPALDLLEPRTHQVFEPTRALARSAALTQFPDQIATCCWKSVTFRVDNQLIEVDLPPNHCYSEELRAITDVKQYIEAIKLCS